MLLEPKMVLIKRNLETDNGVNAERSEKQKNKPLENLLTTTESSGRVEGEILVPQILRVQASESSADRG